MAAVFISYKSEDIAYAKRLYKALEDEGIEAFWDKTDLKGGDLWERRLYDEIEASYIVVVLISKKWLDAPWTIGEYIVARYTTRVVIPVLIEKVDDEKLKGKIDFNVQWIKSFDLNAIVNAIKAHLLQSDIKVWQGDPYPGLAAFNERQSPIFFGRSEEILACLKEVDRFSPTGKKALVVQAASGMGKSSLLQAGIIPQLKAAYPHREVVLFRPGEEPEKALHRALRRAVRGTDTSKLSVDETIERIKRTNDKEALFLCIDQAEEMFALPKSKEDKDAFIALLGRLVFECDDIYLIATLRADFSHLLYSELLSDKKNRYAVVWLGPMTKEGIRDIIVKPTRLIGVDVCMDEVLVRKLLNDFSDSTMLPLLAYTLRNLYLSAKASGRKTIGMEDYRRNDIANMINAGADEAFDIGTERAAKTHRKNESAIQTYARDAMINFCIRYEGDKVLKQKVPDNRLLPEVKPVFEAFVDARLMIKDTSERTATYEFVHETIFHYWNKLSGWIEEGRDFLRIKRRVDEAFALWLASEDKDKDRALLHGLLLDAALPYKEKFFDERLRRFIEESDEKRERERKSRRAFIVGSFASLSAFGTFSSWEWYQANRAEKKIQRQALALDSEVKKAKHNIGLMFAEKAFMYLEKRHIAKAQYYIYNAIKHLKFEWLQDDYLASIIGVLDCYDCMHIAYKGTNHRAGVYKAHRIDERTVATCSEDGTIRFWDKCRGKEIEHRRIDFGRQVKIRDFYVDENGTYIAKERELCFLPQGIFDAKQCRTLYRYKGEIEQLYSQKHLQRIYGVTTKGEVSYWDMQASQMVFFEPINHTIYRLTIKKDYLYASMKGGDIGYWHTGTKEFIGFFPKQHRKSILGLQWYDDNVLVTGSDDNIIVFWDIDTKQPNQFITTQHPVKSLVIRKPFLFYGDGKGNLVRYDLRLNKVDERLQVHTQKIYWILSCHGRFVNVSWDQQLSYVEMPERNRRLFPGHDQEVYETVWLTLNDTSYVLSAGRDRIIRLWNVKTRHCIREYRAHHYSVYAVRMLSDHTRFLSSSWDHTIVLWDFDDAKPIRTFYGHTGDVMDIALCPDEQSFVSVSSDKTVRLWHMASSDTSKILYRHQAKVYAVALHKKSRRIASVSIDGYMYVYDLNQRRIVRIYQPNDSDCHMLFAVIFSHDGRYAYVGADNGTIYRWDLLSPQVQYERAYRVHTHRVYKIRLSFDGRYFFSSSRDGTVRRVEIQSGKSEIITRHMLRVYALDLSKDDRYIVSGAWDKKIHIVDLSRTPFHMVDLKQYPKPDILSKSNKTFRLHSTGQIIDASVIDDEIQKISKALQITLDDSNQEQHLDIPFTQAEWIKPPC